MASFVTRPAISQWPVIVSLPAEASRIAPHAAAGAATGATPAIAVRWPSPSAPRFGSESPEGPTRASRERFPSVSAPASPYSAASGAPPQPTPSATRMMARSKRGVLMPIVRRACRA